MPGAFKVGGQWRVSVPRFIALVHGLDQDPGDGGAGRPGIATR